MKIQMASVILALAVATVVCYSSAAVIASSTLENCAGQPQPQGERTTFQESMEIPDSIRELDISSIRHSIVLEQDQDATGKLTMDNDKNAHDENIYRLMMTHDESKMTVKIESADTVLNVGQEDVSNPILRIKLPSSFKGTLTAKNVSGDVTLPALDLEACSMTTTSGVISMRGGQCGSAELQTTTGEIELNDVSGKTISLESVSGNIKLHRSSFAEKISVTGVSGNVEIDLLKTPSNSLQGKLVSGNFQLTLPDQTTVQFSLETKNGTIKNTRYGDSQGSGLNPVNGDSLSNRPTVDFTSVSGDIVIR